ncbi:MAG: citrate synthase, partial [Ilumatobacteraceae bacterium]|nr:citrate synthase [Ilumatobacteraceae bacterium]
MADTITIIDDRTGKKVTVPITDGVFSSSALRDLDPNLFMYDPAYLSTASCASSITYLDGEAGILRYRGYPIEQLAENSTFLEVAYLLINGQLPTAKELSTWQLNVTHHTMIHENMRKRFVDGFHYDAHPMGMFISAIAALGTFYDDAKDIFEKESFDKQILRLVAKVPTIAAMCYRFSQGLPFVSPNNSLSYGENFLNMMFRIGDDYKVDPVLARAMDVLFILHADHEQNCGTTAMRVVSSANSDPYTATAAAAAALYGPLHGGANEAVVRMLTEIGDVSHVPAFIESVKAGNGRLMGFGHRVYKNFDPRATIIKNTAYEVFQVTGMNPLLEVAVALEKAALSDDYFVSRKLYPNVDFYSGLIYQALGFPVDMFTVL